MSAPAATVDDDSLRSRALLAATRLALRVGDAPLSAADACREAGLPPDSASRLWPEALQFELDLLAALLDEVRDSVAKITSGMPPGLPRLQLAIEAYLEANLARPALRRLGLQLQRHAAGAAILRSRVAGFTLMMEMELKTLHWPHPAASARLFTAALLETAYAEYEARHALPELRGHLFRHLERHPS